MAYQWLCGQLLTVLILSTSHVFGNDGLDTVRSDPAMKGLYSMTQSFLNDVQSYTLGDLMEEYNIETFGDFSDVGSDWQNWGKEMIGLVACVAVGALFIIVFPVVGCCYCCCRTCCGGCCCGACSSKEKQKSKPSMVWTLTCTGLALGTAIIMFSMTMCAYVSTGLVQDEIAGRMLDDMAKSIRETEGFAHDAADDIDKFVLGNLGDLNDEIEDSLTSLPDTIMAEIDNMTQAESSLNKLANFTGGLPELEQALTDMDRATLDGHENTLVGQIVAFQGGDLEDDLETCTMQACKEALTDLRDLQVSQIAADLTSTSLAKLAVEEAITKDIPGQVEALVAGLEKVNDDIEAEISVYVDEALAELEEAADTVNESLSDVLQIFKDVQLENVARDIDDVNAEIEPYAAYYGYVLFSLTTVMLLVTVMWIAGALMGVLGGSTAKKHGANLLLAGVSFTFLFSWLFMLITTVTFVIGGLADVAVCRHIVGFDDTAEKLVEVTRNSMAPDFDYNISMKEALDSCQQDQAVYTALNLEENGFNITELLDLDQYGIYDELEKLKNVTFDLGEVDVITPEVNTSLIAMDTALATVDFDKNLELLAEPITTPDLLQFKEDLVGIVDELRSAGEDSLANDIETEANNLQGIIDGSYTDVSDERANVETATEEGQSLSDISLATIVEDLNQAQTSLNEDLDGLVSKIMGTTVDELIHGIQHFITVMDDGIRNDLITCRSLFDIFQTVTYAPCVYFLYPFNALWYSYGACLFFAIPGLVFATKSVGYFRRMNQYTKVWNEPVAVNDYEMMISRKKGGVVTPPV